MNGPSASKTTTRPMKKSLIIATAMFLPMMASAAPIIPGNGGEFDCVTWYPAMGGTIGHSADRNAPNSYQGQTICQEGIATARRFYNLEIAVQGPPSPDAGSTGAGEPPAGSARHPDSRSDPSSAFGDRSEDRRLGKARRGIGARHDRYTAVACLGQESNSSKYGTKSSFRLSQSDFLSLL